MKAMFILLTLTTALSASASTIECKADLFSSVGEDSTLVNSDTRSLKLDKNGNAQLLGITIDSFEKHGISYNYSVSVKDGKIDSVSAQNEISQNASGIYDLEGQSKVKFEIDSLKDSSSLSINCSTK